MHQAAGVRDGVDDLVLVRPPVGETGTTSAVGGDFVSHLVAFEDVLQRADPDTEFLHRAHEGEYFILPIRVAVNPALALDDLPERLQLKVASRWRTAFFSEATPLAIVLPRGGESVFVKHRNAHPGLWEPGVFVVAPVGLLHIFAKRELDARRGCLKLERLWSLANPQLDDRILAADRVGRAVQQVGHGQSACKLAMDFRRLGVDDVTDRDHRRRG